MSTTSPTAAPAATVPNSATGRGDRPALTRDTVVAAARQQIIDRGADAVSLRKVAQDLGVTAPALYAYVADKQEMLRAVAEIEFGRLIERFAAIDTDDPVERIRQLSRAYVDHALENPELFRAMFLFPPELSIGDPTGRELPIATHAFQSAFDAVREAVEAGTFRPVEPVMASLTLWTATHGLADVLLLGFAFDDATRDLMVDQVLDTVIRGLRA